MERISAITFARALCGLAALLVCFHCEGAQAGAAEDPFPGLVPGGHPVGFRTIELVDRSRTVRSAVDFRGERVCGEHHRAILTAFWYPAVPGGETDCMTYRRYVEIKAAEGLGPLSDSLRAAGIAAHRAELVRDGGEEGLIAALLELPTRAIAEARAAPGPFPLVIVAQGGYSDSYSNSYLCEYIASHGFTVASFPTKGMTSTRLETDLRGVEAQTRDMEFLLGELRELPNVDASRPGLVGRSWGGLTATVLALRNHDIAVVVSLDGTIITQWAYDEMTRLYPYFEGRRLRAAFVSLFAATSAATDFSETFVEEALYADRYQIRFPRMRHESFASDDLLSAFRIGPGVRISVPLDEETVADLVADYEAACRYTLWGLCGYLQHDEASLERLRRAELDYRPALPPPPSEGEFVAVLEQEGADTARVIFEAARKRDPGVQIFSQGAVARAGYAAINDERYEFARAVFEMYAAAYPESGNAWHGLGEASMFLGERGRAVECFQRSIELIPENTIARQYIEDLGAADR